jgi:hypothetical protein
LIANTPLCKYNVFKTMCGCHARYKIDNKTFNALKNLGSNFENVLVMETNTLVKYCPT